MSVRFDFSGSAVLVTGATSGIGYEIACQFRDAGAEVTVTGTRAAAGEYDLALDGFTYRQCVLTDPNAIDAVVASIDRLDVLINNAGANLPGGRDEYTPEVFHEAVTINLIGPQRLCAGLHAQLAKSGQKGGAAIVNLASLGAFFGVTMVPGYVAAKAGLVGLTRTLAAAWAADAIRVNAVAPGVIETPMTAPMMPFASMTAPMLDRTPLGRFGTPEDIAPTVLFLCSDAARYVTGQTWLVDGGFSIVG
jgi:NAD(P)-dependent dehydrogenase (short-subunit alcohol dehydrogenase family)